MPTPPGFADISLKFELAGLVRAAYITFAVDPTDTDPTIVASNVINAINAATSLKSITDSNVTISGIRVSMGTDGSEDLATEVPTVIAGGAGLSGAPPNCAALVHKTTSRGGRRGRGRMFIPWVLDEGSVTEAGLLVGAHMTTLQTACNNFLTALTTFGVPMYLLHNPSTPETTKPTVPGAPNLVTGLKVDAMISTQRRRLGR